MDSTSYLFTRHDKLTYELLSDLLSDINLFLSSPTTDVVGTQKLRYKYGPNSNKSGMNMGEIKEKFTRSTTHLPLAFLS